LYVLDFRPGTTTVDGYHSSVVSQSGTQTDQAFHFGSYQTIQPGVLNSGVLYGVRGDAFISGGGTLTTAIASELFAGVTPNQTGFVTTAMGQRVNVWKSGGTITNGFGVRINDVEATYDWAFYQDGGDDTNYFAGDLLIGTLTGGEPGVKLKVQGNVKVVGEVSGTKITAHYQDVAEWVPATVEMTPGTVVVLNPQAINEVMPSMRGYDTSVAGVVSAEPGVILGVPGASKEQIATTGRVRVRVDARSAPIAVGDLLVTSDTPGTAMKSQPVAIGSTAMHRPGTIVGKALEPLAGGQGEILVLLSLQ